MAKNVVSLYFHPFIVSAIVRNNKKKKRIKETQASFGFIDESVVAET